MNLRHLWMRAKAAIGFIPPQYDLEPGEVVWSTTSAWRVRPFDELGWLIVTDQRLLFLPYAGQKYLTLFMVRPSPIAVMLDDISDVARERGWRRWLYRDLPWWPVWSIHLRSGERIRFRTPQIPLVHQTDASGRETIQPFAKVQG